MSVTLCVLSCPLFLPPVLWSWVLCLQQSFTPASVWNMWAVCWFCFNYRRGRRRKDDKSPRLPKRRWEFILLLCCTFFLVGRHLTHIFSHHNPAGMAIQKLDKSSFTNVLDSELLYFYFHCRILKFLKILRVLYLLGGCWFILLCFL